jgi:hypothetical protein
VVIDTVNKNPEIAAMAVYSHNGTSVASSIPVHIGKLLPEAQKSLFKDDVDEAMNAVHKGEKRRFKAHSESLNMDMELIIYPFTIGEIGVSWTLMLATNKGCLLRAAILHLPRRSGSWLSVVECKIPASVNFPLV